MLQRLDYDQKDKTAKQVRAEFDDLLKTKIWRVSPAVETKREAANVDKSAPWWWEGEEEASESFLSAMGVDLSQGG